MIISEIIFGKYDHKVSSIAKSNSIFSCPLLHLVTSGNGLTESA